jgi:hypothetical protein
MYAGEKIALTIRTMQPQTVAGQVLYKDHTIISIVRMSTPVEDPAKYFSVAMISWKLPDRQRRIMYCLTLERLFRSVEDARSAAIERAKAWVDYHNREFEPLVTQVS